MRKVVYQVFDYNNNQIAIFYSRTNVREYVKWLNKQIQWWEPHKRYTYKAVIMITKDKQ